MLGANVGRLADHRKTVAPPVDSPNGSMTLPSTDNGVAIVGYSYRMPGGIQSDSDSE